MADLAGHTAIISGGLGDIGRATAVALARGGANVGLGDVLEPRQADDCLNELRGLGVQARYDRADVSDYDAVARWVAAVEADLGVADLVIVNAAIVAIGPFQELTAATWRRELSVNLDGAFHMAHAAALRLLQLKKTGRIVFTGSWVGYTPQLHIPAYCVAKAGLRMLCKCVALALAEHDILVNEVAPGLVEAGLSAKITRADPDAMKRGREHVPIHRLISAAQVAREIVHLCDPLNQHMTGATLLLDGGLSLLSGPNRTKGK